MQTTSPNNTTQLTTTTSDSLLGVDARKAFEPRNVAEACDYAGLLVRSKFLPRAVTSAEAAFAIIATGRELGMTALQSLRAIHVIDGKPTLSADLIAALCKKSPDLCRYFRLVQTSDTVATYETHRVGEPSPTRLSFTFAEAQRAGLTNKDNWRKFPAAMLRARAITALARAVYPDLVMGIYDPDEVTVANDASAPVESPRESETVVTVVQDEDITEVQSVFTAILERIDAAQSGSELDALAREAVREAKRGGLTVGELQTLKTAVVNARRAKPSTQNTPAVNAEVVQ
jgi:hypothetical protein